MMVETEQVAGDVTDNVYLVDNLAGMFFFLHLLFYEPLDHLKSCVIFLLNCRIDNPWIMAVTFCS